MRERCNMSGIPKRWYSCNSQLMMRALTASLKSRPKSYPWLEPSGEPMRSNASAAPAHRVPTRPTLTMQAQVEANADGRHAQSMTAKYGNSFR